MSLTWEPGARSTFRGRIGATRKEIWRGQLLITEAGWTRRALCFHQHQSKSRAEACAERLGRKLTKSGQLSGIYSEVQIIASTERPA